MCLPCFGTRWVCSFHSVHSQGGEDLAVSSLGSLASLDKVHEREAASKTHHKWTPNLLTQLLNLFSCLTSPPQSTTKNMSATLCNYVGLQCKRHLIVNKVLWGDEQKWLFGLLHPPWNPLTISTEEGLKISLKLCRLLEFRICWKMMSRQKVLRHGISIKSLAEQFASILISCNLFLTPPVKEPIFSPFCENIKL